MRKNIDLKACLCLVFLVMPYAVIAAKDFSRYAILLETDPEQALIEVGELWQNKPVDVDSIAEGLLMVRALIENKRTEQAQSLVNQFNQLENLSLNHQGLLMGPKIQLARLTKNKEQLDGLIQQGYNILAELKKQPDDVETTKVISNLHHVIGLSYYKEGNFPQAQTQLQLALDHLNDTQIYLKSDILNTIGVSKAQQANLDGAAEDMLQSIKILENNELPVNPSRYQNLGSLNFMLKNWDLSIELGRKSLALQTTETAATASTYNNMAAAYVEKNELQKATEQLNQSILISEKIGTSTASARNNLAYIYNQLGNYEAAIQQLEISKNEFIKDDREEELSVTYKSMADVYANMAELEKASNLYNQAYQLHKKHDFAMKRVELYPKWIEVLTQIGDYKKAYEMMVEFKALNDEIINVESTQKVNELMTAFEVEKNKRALLDSELDREKKQKDIELLESETAFDQKIQLLLILLLLGLFSILFLVIRAWRYRGKVNRVLIDKNLHIQKQHESLSELNSLLKQQAQIDTLTGLKNRRFITQFIAKKSVQSDIGPNHWSLIIIDIDNFKQINDQYGHQKGDDILVQFSNCLKETKAADDVVARWGGEEFLWLAKTTPDTRPQSHCDNLQSKLRDTLWIDDESIHITCSMGFSSFPLISLNFDDWEAALKLADHALYHAKNSGKNQWYGFKIVDRKLDYKEVENVNQLLKGKRIEMLSK